MYSPSGSSPLAPTEKIRRKARGDDELAAGALEYVAPIVIASNVRVTARVRMGA